MDGSMRMIEDFVRVISKVMFFREMKQYVNAMGELENLNRSLTGFDLAQIKELGIEGLKNYFDLNNYSDIEKIFYSAKTIKEEAVINFERGKTDDGFQSVAFALGMFELIKKHDSKKEIHGLDEEISLIRSRIN
jgi:hypothetical protein